MHPGQRHYLVDRERQPGQFQFAITAQELAGGHDRTKPAEIDKIDTREIENDIPATARDKIAKPVLEGDGDTGAIRFSSTFRMPIMLPLSKLMFMA